MAFNDYTTNLNLFNDYSKKVNIVQLIKIKLFVNIEEIEYEKNTVTNGFGTFGVYKFTESNYLINREAYKSFNGEDEDIDYMFLFLKDGNKFRNFWNGATDFYATSFGIFVDSDNKVNLFILNTFDNRDKIYIKLQVNVTNDTKINFLYDQTQFANVSPFIDEYYNYDEIFLPYLLDFADVSRTLTFDLDDLGNNSPCRFSLLNQNGIFDYLLGDCLLDGSFVQIYLKNLNESQFNVIASSYPIDPGIAYTDYFDITGNGLRLISEGYIKEIDDDYNKLIITTVDRLLKESINDIKSDVINIAGHYYDFNNKKENQNFNERIIPILFGPRSKYNLVTSDEVSGFTRGIANFESMYSFIIKDYDETISGTTNRELIFGIRPVISTPNSTRNITSVDNSLADFTILTIPYVNQNQYDFDFFVEGGSYIIENNTNTYVTTAKLHKISLSGYVFEKNLLINNTHRVPIFKNQIPIVCITDDDNNVEQLINGVHYDFTIDISSGYHYIGIILKTNFEASIPTLTVYDPNINEVRGMSVNYGTTALSKNYIFERLGSTTMGIDLRRLFIKNTSYDYILSNDIDLSKTGFIYLNIDETNISRLGNLLGVWNEMFKSIFCFIDLSVGGYLRMLNIKRNINLSYLYDLKINEDLILSNIKKKIITPDSSKVKLINQYKNAYEKFSASYFEFENNTTQSKNFKEENIITDFESYIKEDDKIYKGFPVINDSIYFFFYLVYKTSKRTYYTIELPLIFADVNLGQTVEVQRKLIKRSETDSLVYEKLIVTGIEYQAEKIILTCLDYPKNYEVQLS
jgi:hypothetical protein